MNKRMYGLLPNPVLRAMIRDRQPFERGKKKHLKDGKTIVCSQCGRNDCTLYGTGEKKLCKRCGGGRK